MNKFNKETETNNLWKLFQIIQNESPISRNDLQKKSGLSWGSVSTMITKLYKKGFIDKKQRDEKVVGRNPDYFSICTENNFCLGIDINVSGLTFVICDLGWEVHQLIKVNLLSRKKEDIIEQLTLNTNELLAKYKSILFISLSVQGTLNQKKDLSTFDGFKGWNEVPLKKIFEEKFKIPTFLYHDPDCLMMYHQKEKHIPSKALATYLLLKLDDGIGMSLVINNEIFESHAGLVCEIGHICVENNGRKCSCGNKGCLEAYCSLYGLINIYNEKFNKKISISDFTHLLDKNDKEATKLLLDNFKYLNMTIGNLAMLFNPHRFIIDGKLAKYSDLFLPKLEEYLRSTVPNKCKFYIAEFKTEACALGACVLTINNRLKDLIN
ncbi:MAG: ROK family transcriptional regulator [Bacilli bacterium]|nr:ROK family transcriptional regulator [Bacilli bacterium]MBR1582121.1 ROK family transcriptional regulator [Bacilli bacterium]